MTDIKGALERQDLNPGSIHPGDALFYNTGWGELWKKDNEEFNSGKPGLTQAAADWLIDKEVLLIATDNWGVDASPYENEGSVARLHQKILVEHGIYIIENLDFSSLIEDEVYEFAFAVSPVAYKGATGAPVRPFAIR